jgi:hypothetical protein
MYVGPQVGSLVDLQLVNRAGAKSTESRCAVGGVIRTP